MRAGPAAHPRSAQPEHGRQFSQIRPAPGYRDPGQNGLFGAPGGVGLHGYSWSTAANGILGRFLWFNTQDLYPCHAASLAGGLQLRCLSE
ncbi:hypothetical protein [uncultured Rikenella sp.]|uniref:hypothetical protein n=1 Tax=uncultured Rikenella sp. TaxID=368003 RepID=UPI0025DDB628|nr:hypothetical protein [uncultured Rikenella sp.]